MDSRKGDLPKTDSRSELAVRARRAYELGRARRAVLGVWPVLPITAIAAMFGDTATAAALAIPLAAVSAVLLYVGRGFDRAVVAGWNAGVIPMVAALALWQGSSCVRPCTPWCFPMCVTTSLVVGAWLGSKMGERERSGPALASLVIAALTASLGCAVIGMGALAGAVVGLGVGLGPVWAYRSALRH